MDILLVGYQDQDNLGLRYLLSSIEVNGFVGDIETYSSTPERLVSRAQQEKPTIIGFSLIFQYMTPDFAKVISALRNAGISAHITMGGHYPSFEYVELLEYIDGLDSIVRFEGEHTLVELLKRVSNLQPWQKISGLACRSSDGSIIVNPLREVVEDLDTLPWPNRESIDYEANPIPTASILGSRGCPWNCSF